MNKFHLPLAAMGRLGIHHLETISALVEHGSIRDAATALSTTASTLSHRLAEAERRLGEPIFDRGPGRRVRPTPSGSNLAQQASRALLEFDRAEEEFLRSAGLAIHVVRLGVGGYDAYHWFQRFLAAVEEAGLSVAIDLVVVGDAPAIALASGDVDVVVAQGTPTGSFSSRPLFEDEMGLVTRPDHPVVGMPFVEPADLVNQRYLSYSRTPWPGFEYDRFVRPAGFQPLVVSVIERTSTIVEMVAAGSGVSILSRWALQPSLALGRVAWTRCGEDGLSLTWHRLTRRGEATPHVLQVADLLTDVLHS